MVHELASQHTDSTSASEACGAVDLLLSLRLYETNNVQWIEKAIITRIWLTSEQVQPRTSTDFDLFMEWLDGCFSKLAKPLTAVASHAAQTVVQKDLFTRSASS